MTARLGTAAAPYNPTAAANLSASNSNPFTDDPAALVTLQIAETGTCITSTSSPRASVLSAGLTMPILPITSDRHSRILHTLSPAWTTGDTDKLEFTFALKVSAGMTMSNTGAVDEGGIDTVNFNPELIRIQCATRKLLLKMRRRYSATALLNDTFELYFMQDDGLQTFQPSTAVPQPEIVAGQWHQLSIYVTGFGTTEWTAQLLIDGIPVMFENGPTEKAVAVTGASNDNPCILTTTAADAWVSGSTYSVGTIRSYDDGVSTANYTCIKATGAGQTTSPDSDTVYWRPTFSDNDIISMAGTGATGMSYGGMVSMSGNPLQVYSASGLEIAVGIDTTDFAEWDAGWTATLKHANPWVKFQNEAEADVPQIVYVGLRANTPKPAITGGTGYTNGTYTGVTVYDSDGHDHGTKATVVVSGTDTHVVSAVTVTTRGTPASWANMTFDNAALGGGTGAKVTIYGYVHAQVAVNDLRVMTGTDTSSTGRQFVAGLWPIPQSASEVKITAHCVQACTSATLAYGTVSGTYGDPVTGTVSKDGGLTVDFTLSGLAANKTYYYQATLINATETYVTRECSFKTDPGASTAVTVAITNDNQDYRGRAQTAAGMLIDAPDLVLTAGDVCDMMTIAAGTYPGQWDYQLPTDTGPYLSRLRMVHRASQCLRDLAAGRLVLPGLGNHEMDPYHSADNPSWAYWLSRVPQPSPNYSYDWGMVHFAHLGPLYVVSEEGPDSGDLNLDWLEADLQASGRSWNVVICHYPGYGNPYFRTDATTGSSRPLKRRWELHQVLRDNGAQICIGAHINHFNIFRSDGVAYIINGASGIAGGGSAAYNKTDAFEDWGESYGNYGTAPTAEEGARLAPGGGSSTKSFAAYGGYCRLTFAATRALVEFVDRVRGGMDGSSRILSDHRRVIYGCEISHPVATRTART